MLYRKIIFNQICKNLKIATTILIYLICFASDLDIIGIID